MDSLSSTTNINMSSGENYSIQNYKWQSLLGGTGFAGGIVYAFVNKTGFWKGWGVAIIGGIALGGIGYGIDQFSNKK